jgi:hypothetical protein
MRVMIVGAAGTMASVVIRDLLSSVDDLSITAADSRPIPFEDRSVQHVNLDIQDEERAARPSFKVQSLRSTVQRLNSKVQRARSGPQIGDFGLWTLDFQNHDSRSSSFLDSDHR